MSLLRHTPHTVTVTRPKTKQDSDSKASYQDYADPESGWPKTYKGLFQARGGTLVQGDEGLEIPYDAIFYTKETAIADNDRVQVSLSWHTGTFRVVAVQGKARLAGQYSHMEVVLQKDTR